MMENRLKKLKKSIDHSEYSNLTFTNDHKRNVMNRIRQTEERDEDILLAVLQLLAEPKTGFELTQRLRSRGIKKFEEDEGALYTLLHSIELKNWVGSTWNDHKQKEYYLQSKGKKIVKKAEHPTKALNLMALLER